MNFRSGVIGLLLALLMGVSTGIFIGKYTAPKTYIVKGAVKHPSLSTGSDSDISAEEIELTQGSGGDIEWKLKAGNADYDQESGMVLADKPRVTYYLGRDRKEVHVKALYGKVSQKGEGLKLWDNVEGLYGDLHLRSDVLNFKPQKNLLILSGKVKVNSPSVLITAKKVTVDLKTREIMIDDGVDALLSPDIVATPQ